YTSDFSGSSCFRVQWEGCGKGRNVAGFHVQYKVGMEGGWQNWLTDTPEKSGQFPGAGGHTYYFRVRARDELGNWGNWSGEGFAVVPVDDRSPLVHYEGRWDVSGNEESYLQTLHHSETTGAAVSLRFAGWEAALVSTCGPDRGQAHVYIDGALQTTVDLYSEEYAFRRKVFTASLDGKPHTIRVEVAGTKNPLSAGYRVDIDGFAVKS
ncbi:MAG: fibronectin type III domain-containing protein, partial [Firmicutes bacterium]|nr:fibronectin type III domain-containing protein [Bacillota bacterium]